MLLWFLDVWESVVGEKLWSFRELWAFGFQVFFVFGDCVFVETLERLKKKENWYLPAIFWIMGVWGISRSKFGGRNPVLNSWCLHIGCSQEQNYPIFHRRGRGFQSRRPSIKEKLKQKKRGQKKVEKEKCSLAIRKH